MQWHLMDDAAIATLKKNGTYLVPTLFLGEYMNAHLGDVPEFSRRKMPTCWAGPIGSARWREGSGRT
jgi:hypothetical protein